MKKVLIPLFVTILILIYALYNYMNKSSYEYRENSLILNNKSQSKKVYPNTQNGVVDYIVDVINNGSSRLNVSKEFMEGGYIPKDKARDVACYVYELSGKKCLHSYSKDAKLYFSSTCAGCHGDDGKGIHGAYPDLTKSPLLGIKNFK